MTTQQVATGRPHEVEAHGQPGADDHARARLLARLRVAEDARARYGWPLHVIDSAGDDPAMEQPEAFLAALRAALKPAHGAEVTA